MCEVLGSNLCFACGKLRTYFNKRPYVGITILVVSAILTPPDVVSQLLLIIPTWILFELGVFLASRIEDKNKSA